MFYIGLLCSCVIYGLERIRQEAEIFEQDNCSYFEGKIISLFPLCVYAPMHVPM